MAAARKWPFAKSSGIGVSGAGCLAGFRNGAGTAMGVSWWNISGRKRCEKSRDETGMDADGAGDRAGERELARELACCEAMNRAAGAIGGDRGDDRGPLGRLQSACSSIYRGAPERTYSSGSSGPLVNVRGRTARKLNMSAILKAVCWTGNDADGQEWLAANKRLEVTCEWFHRNGPVAEVLLERTEKELVPFMIDPIVHPFIQSCLSSTMTEVWIALTPSSRPVPGMSLV